MDAAESPQDLGAYQTGPERDSPARRLDPRLSIPVEHPGRCYVVDEARQSTHTEPESTVPDIAGPFQSPRDPIHVGETEILIPEEPGLRRRIGQVGENQLGNG